jgi:hypothetical protein
VKRKWSSTYCYRVGTKVILTILLDDTGGILRGSYMPGAFVGHMNLNWSKNVKIVIGENDVTFTPESSHEEMALDILKKVRTVKVQATDGWNDSDKRVSFVWEKDTW